MSKPFPTWAHEDLETISAILQDAADQVASAEDDSTVSRPLRRHLIEVHAGIKAGGILLRKILSHQETLLDAEKRNGKEPEETGTRAA